MPNKKKNSPAAKKTAKKNVSHPRKTTAKEELDVVAQAQAELKKLENANNYAATPTNKGGLSIPTLVGGLLIGAAAMWLGTKMINPSNSMGVNGLEKELPTIIEPLAGGMAVEAIGTPEKIGEVYKFTIKFADVEEAFTSYITGDAQTFFVEGIPVSELVGGGAAADPAAAGGEVSAASCDTINKNAAPMLTAYIVSDCPYGKQMQQVMLNAITQAPEIADSFKVRYFFDTINDDGTATAMHGPDEGVEGLRQICIREEQADLYWDYVACYANSTNTDTVAAAEACLTTAGVNVANVNSCMTTPARGPTFARADNAAAQAMTVQGSPTLVMNDTETVSENNFGGRNANGLKTMLCCSSDQALPFCSTTFSSDTAAAAGNC